MNDGFEFVRNANVLMFDGFTKRSERANMSTEKLKLHTTFSPNLYFPKAGYLNFVIQRVADTSGLWKFLKADGAHGLVHVACLEPIVVLSVQAEALLVIVRTWKK